MVRILDLTNDSEWSEIVRSFGKHDIYYLPEYVRPFMYNRDGPAFLFYFCNDRGRAINVFHIRDIAHMPEFKTLLEEGEWFDIITPYGYGGMLAECEGDRESFLDDVYDAFDEWCNDNDIITEFARFHPIIDNYSYLADRYKHYLTRETVYMDMSAGEEALWNSMDSKSRNMVRKAEKSGIKIIRTGLNDLLDDFIPIYRHTMKRNNASEYYNYTDDFFSCLGDSLNGNAGIFAAEFKGNIVAGSIILYHDAFMHYHLSGAYSEFMNLAPNNLILWEAAKWGCGNGFEVFHLGAGTTASKDDSLYKFKASFSKQCRAEAHQGMRIFNRQKYYHLVSLRERSDKTGRYNTNTAFLPQYRAPVLPNS